MSLQFIMATYQSCVQVRQQVGWHLAVTNCFVCTGEFLWKSCLHNTIFSTSSHTNSVGLIWFWVTCCSDKILLQRQICKKILQYTRQFAICHGNLLSQRAAANCCQVCFNLLVIWGPFQTPSHLIVYSNYVCRDVEASWTSCKHLDGAEWFCWELKWEAIQQTNNNARSCQVLIPNLTGMGIKVLLKAMLIHKHKGIENKEMFN